MTDAELLAELNNDPVALGYAAAGWTQEPAPPPTIPEYEAIHALLTGPNRSEDVDVSGSDLFLAIIPADFLGVYSGANEAHKEYLRWLKDLPRVPLKDAGVRTALQTIFVGKTQTLNALAALQTRPISRAAELGHTGRVRVGDLKRVRGDLT